MILYYYEARSDFMHGQHEFGGFKIIVRELVYAICRVTIASRKQLSANTFIRVHIYVYLGNQHLYCDIKRFDAFGHTYSRFASFVQYFIRNDCSKLGMPFEFVLFRFVLFCILHCIVFFVYCILTSSIESIEIGYDANIRYKHTHTHAHTTTCIDQMHFKYLPICLACSTNDTNYLVVKQQSTESFAFFLHYACSVLHILKVRGGFFGFGDYMRKM